MSQDIQAKEDLNSDGFQWASIIPRKDINIQGGSIDIKPKCPFVNGVKFYIENVFTDLINIAIDKYKIRSWSKLHKLSDLFLLYYQKQDRLPDMKTIKPVGDPDGIKVIYYLGNGYMVPINWTEYNEAWNDYIIKYKQVGINEIERFIEEVQENLDD